MGKKVCVALSGGIDSSTTAAILLEKGYDCFAVFMITCEQGFHTQSKAEKVAGELGIKLHILDLREEFEQILDYFCGEYMRARTPNPCVQCNRTIKFKRLWEFAKEHSADYFATGHYARVLPDERGQKGLYAADTAKDQSYALAMINKNILEHLLLPLGDYSKDQTREMAKQFNLSTTKYEESQEICFIPDDDYAAVLEKRCPEIIKPGKIVDSSGKILGEHNGLYKYTIGQRRGLKIAMGEPYYVVKLDAKTNTVTLGPKAELMHSKLSACGINWLIEQPEKPFSATVKIRYNNCGTAAFVYLSDDYVEVEFEESVSAITPGQLAVFYITENNKNRIAGGGWIEKAWD